eukprot:jgi/Bigna1/142933/aug1.74_g17641
MLNLMIIKLVLPSISVMVPAFALLLLWASTALASCYSVRNDASWVKVRTINSSAADCPYFTDNLNGSQAVGAVTGGGEVIQTYDGSSIVGFKFETGNGANFLIARRFQVIGETYTGSSPRDVYCSSYSNSSYTAEWYNRGSSNPSDPLIFLRGYSTSTTSKQNCFYCEYEAGQGDPFQTMWQANGGIDIYVTSNQVFPTSSPTAMPTASPATTSPTASPATASPATTSPTASPATASPATTSPTASPATASPATTSPTSSPTSSPDDDDAESIVGPVVGAVCGFLVLAAVVGYCYYQRGKPSVDQNANDQNFAGVVNDQKGGNNAL